MQKSEDDYRTTFEMDSHCMVNIIRYCDCREAIILTGLSKNMYALRSTYEFRRIYWNRKERAMAREYSHYTNSFFRPDSYYFRMSQLISLTMGMPRRNPVISHLCKTNWNSNTSEKGLDTLALLEAIRDNRGSDVVNKIIFSHCVEERDNGGRSCDYVIPYVMQGVGTLTVNGAKVNSDIHINILQMLLKLNINMSPTFKFDNNIYFIITWYNDAELLKTFIRYASSAIHVVKLVCNIMSNLTAENLDYCEYALNYSAEVIQLQSSFRCKFDNSAEIVRYMNIDYNINEIATKCAEAFSPIARRGTPQLMEKLNKCIVPKSIIITPRLLERSIIMSMQNINYGCEMFEYLQNKHGNLDITDVNKHTYIYNACEYRNMKLFKYLISKYDKTILHSIRNEIIVRIAKTVDDKVTLYVETLFDALK